MRRFNSRCIDLIYLDPPFNSNANYAAPIGSIAAGAHFKDTWTLKDVDVNWVDVIDKKFPRIQHLLLACGSDSMKSYLIYMAVRIIEMKRILKETGSLYLHCDPTAGHYLKLLLDAIFGNNNFRNEIIWSYDGPQRPSKKDFATRHDIIYRYSLSSEYFANEEELSPFVELSPEELRKYKRSSEGKYYYTLPRGDYTDSSIARLEKEGRIEYTRNGNARVRMFLPVENGKVGRRKRTKDVWNDIVSLGHAGGNERLGYPTQKPLALLERIIKASSLEGDLVFDPFCGCATTLVAADRLRRKWVGVDVSEKAAELVVQRIKRDQPGLLREVHHLTILPRRTDLGKLPNYKSHKKFLYSEQDGYCNGCQKHFESRHLEVDHIIAKKAGGTDHVENLQLLCGHCNRVKGHRGQEYLITYLQLNQKLLKQSRR